MTAIVHAALAGLSHKSDKARKNFYKLKRVEERMQNMSVCGAFTYIVEGIIWKEHTFWLEGACKSTPWAFENLLLRLGSAIFVDAIVLAGLPFYGSYKIVEYCGEKRKARREAKAQAQKAEEKAANEARQKKLAEWKKVEAYNNEIKYVDSGMYTLDKAVVGVEYAKVNKNRKVAKLTTKGGISLYVLFPYSNNKNLSFCWRDEVNIPGKMTVRSEMGQEKIVAAIQRKYNDIQAVKAKVGHKQFGE